MTDLKDSVVKWILGRLHGGDVCVLLSLETRSPRPAFTYTSYTKT